MDDDEDDFVVNCLDDGETYSANEATKGLHVMTISGSSGSESKDDGKESRDAKEGITFIPLRKFLCNFYPPFTDLHVFFVFIRCPRWR